MDGISGASAVDLFHVDENWNARLLGPPFAWDDWWKVWSSLPD